ncbi:hypothetical protein GCM10009608_87550 [Pseudonocardia alaniniphila]
MDPGASSSESRSAGHEPRHIRTPAAHSPAMCTSTGKAEQILRAIRRIPEGALRAGADDRRAVTGYKELTDE